MWEERRSHQATVAGILIGIGMGGFVDASVLYQIAQWNNALLNHTEFVERMREWIEKSTVCPA
jgi:uncharacterized membrane protein